MSVSPRGYSLDQVKAIMRNYGVLEISLARYERERRAIMARAGGSVTVIEGRNRTNPGDPTFRKVNLLDELDKRYADVLSFCGCVQDVVKRLPKDTRKAFRLHFFQGLSIRKAAEKTGMASSTVHRHIERALETIAYFLTQSSGGAFDDE